AMENAEKAFQVWSETSFVDRASFLHNVADILRSKKEQLGRLMSLEMGKPLIQATAEIEKCASVCDYYAQNGEKQLSDELIQTDATSSYITFRPSGAVLAIMPWNFPFWQVLRFAAPTLMAGNVCLLKHAPNVSGCAIVIKKLFDDAGFPEDVFQTLFLQPEDIAKLIEHPFISGVTLTGSTRAGSAVAEIAGRNLKKTVMELGGSDPYVILDDADLEKTVNSCVTGRMINSGQSCIAAKRYIVVESVRKEFEERLTEKFNKITYGNSLEGNFDIGPLARRDLRDQLHNQVTGSIFKGAKLLCGGRIPDGKGYFYPATILSDVKRGMPAYSEETFGPVASIISVEGEKEAIQIANDTCYGLGAAVFTRDVKKGEYIAKHLLNAGSCFVNAFVKSDPRLPFGGTKMSGYGRELSMFGIREFVNIKTVYLA
ncbi:NAD-dependent succinate-semialdehyde dehydrogenase, partial [bacterium]|nr:NAD-dependent succinate-semialdehyde dehydrogenase [bacterium]